MNVDIEPTWDYRFLVDCIAFANELCPDSSWVRPAWLHPDDARNPRHVGPLHREPVTFDLIPAAPSSTPIEAERCEIQFLRYANEASEVTLNQLEELKSRSDELRNYIEAMGRVAALRQEVLGGKPAGNQEGEDLGVFVRLEHMLRERGVAGARLESALKLSNAPMAQLEAIDRWREARDRPLRVQVGDFTVEGSAVSWNFDFRILASLWYSAKNLCGKKDMPGSYQPAWTYPYDPQNPIKLGVVGLSRQPVGPHRLPALSPSVPEDQVALSEMSCELEALHVFYRRRELDMGYRQLEEARSSSPAFELFVAWQAKLIDLRRRLIGRGSDAGRWTLFDEAADRLAQLNPLGGKSREIDQLRLLASSHLARQAEYRAHTRKAHAPVPSQGQPWPPTD